MKQLIYIIFLILTTSLFSASGGDSLKTVNVDSLKKTADTIKVHPAGRRFIDKDGDGFNDLAPDHDGDGIPNGLDKDYRRGRGNGKGFRHRHRHGWLKVPADSSVINDSSKFRSKK